VNYLFDRGLGMSIKLLFNLEVAGEPMNGYVPVYVEPDDDGRTGRPIVYISERNLACVGTNIPQEKPFVRPFGC